jgi:feruloyl esterase
MENLMECRDNRNRAARRPGMAFGAGTLAVALAACGGDNGGSAAATLPLVVSNAAAACAALKGKAVQAAQIGEPTNGAVVTSATFKAATQDTPNAANTAIVPGTPDYCEVLVDIKPVDAAAPMIKSQVNLPASWNGKKLQFGGGGYNGSLITGLQPSRNAPPDVPLPLARGYMTAGTDSGHQTGPTDNAYAFSLNAEALVNFAYASYKKTHDVALQIGMAFYGRMPVKSYYLGASQGGREGMMMAQRYPHDFDGIVSIDPVMNFTGLQTFGNYAGGIVQSRPGAWLGAKVQLVHDTVRDVCDSLDGIADGVVSNYKACKPLADAALAAKRCANGGDEGTSCFSDAQLESIRAAHSGYTFSFPLANGLTSYAGFGYGSEGVPSAWDRWLAGMVPPTTANMANPNASRLYQFGNGFIRYFVAQDPNFDPLGYDPANFRQRVLQLSNLLDATNPDLSVFVARGGKLILREDLSDTAQSPYTGLNYFDAVRAKLGADVVENSMAAYVATGLPHTSPGLPAGSANAPAYGTPGSIDLLGPLENWVESGIKPADQLTLVNKAALPPYATVASKPICRYGSYPRFTGSDPAGGNLASNYTCVAQ